MSRTFLLFAVCLAFLLGVNQVSYGQGRETGREQRGGEGHGMLKSVNGDTITVTVPDPTPGAERGSTIEKTYTLGKDVEVVVATGIGGGRGGVFRPAKLADVPAGIHVGLGLAADQKTVESIVCEEPMVRGVLKTIDAAKKVLSVTHAGARGRDANEADEEKTYTVSSQVEIAVDDGRGRRFSIHEGKFDDLASGAHVTLRLSLDKKQVNGIMAEGPMFGGTVKAVDAGKKTLTLVTRAGGRGEDNGEEKSFTVSPDAVVLIDDGKGRRLSIREAKLADVPVGASAGVKLSVDQNFVMMLRFEGATVTGLFKAADPDKGTIVIAIPKGRGEEPEEKTYNLAKGARVTIDGAEAKLGDIKAGDNGTGVQLRLSLDQKTVQAVAAHQIRGR